MSKFTFCLICNETRVESDYDDIVHAPCDQRLQRKVDDIHCEDDNEMLYRVANRQGSLADFTESAGSARYTVGGDD